MSAQHFPLMRWVALAVLCAVAAAGAATYNLLSILIEPLKEDLSLTDTDVGLITGLGLALIGAFAAFPIGAAADRFGRVPVLAACILTWSVATAVLAIATSKIGFAIGVAGIFIGEAALIPLLYAMIPTLFSARQLRLANLVLVSVIVIGGYGVYALVGALLQILENWTFGGLAPWRIVCLVVATLGAFVTMALFLTSTSSAGRAPRLSAGDLGEAGFINYLKREGLTIGLFYIALSVFFVAFTQGIMFWGPAILQRSFGLSVAEANIMLGTPLIAASAVGLLLSYLLQRMLLPLWGHATAIRIQILACLLGIPIVALMPFAPNAWLYVTAQAILVACMTLPASVAPTLLQDCAPDRYRSRVIALFSVAAVAIRLAFPWAIGSLSDVFRQEHNALLLINVGAMLVALPISAMLLLFLANRYTALVGRVRADDGRAAA